MTKIHQRNQQIIFTEMKEAISFSNPKNNAFFQVSFPHGIMSYCDSMGNTMVNKPITINTNEGSAMLKEKGSNAWSKNGETLAFLDTKDIQELATKTFFEPDQEPIIDFYTFAIDKSRCICIKS